MYMTTFSGMRVDPYNLTPDDIRIEDIAHSLGYLCRFGGHVSEFYSVGQHSIRVARAVPPAYMLEGLLHDATEAYIQDLIRPVKKRLAVYRTLEETVWRALAFKYDLPLSHSVEVVEADESALKAELLQFVPHSRHELDNERWQSIDQLPFIQSVLNPVQSKAVFLVTFAEALAKHSEQKRSSH